MEAWLAQEDLPEPFCLVFSLVNPHDVLGYPSSYERGGYAAEEFRDLGVPLPPTLDEDLRDKPTVQSLTKLGQTSYIGALERARASSRTTSTSTPTCTASWTRRSAGCWRRSAIPRDPASLRSRTVIVRTSDHGELGLSHGGLRQKMFNAYEETIRVPLVVSNPVLFPEARESDALVSLVDLVPTFLGLAGAAPQTRPVRRARPRAAAARGGGPASATRCCSPTTTTRRRRRSRRWPGQPNRIRCVRDRRWKYAVYLDPTGGVAPEYELYDLESDPDEALNLADKRTGRGRTAQAERERIRMHALLEQLCVATGTLTPELPPATGHAD